MAVKANLAERRRARRTQSRMRLPANLAWVSEAATAAPGPVHGVAASRGRSGARKGIPTTAADSGVGGGGMTVKAYSEGLEERLRPRCDQPTGRHIGGDNTGAGNI